MGPGWNQDPLEKPEEFGGLFRERSVGSSFTKPEF